MVNTPFKAISKFSALIKGREEKFPHIYSHKAKDLKRSRKKFHSVVVLSVSLDSEAQFLAVRDPPWEKSNGT